MRTLILDTAIGRQWACAVGLQLMMANKTPPPQGLNAVLIDALFSVALRAIIHFHAIPGVALETGDIFAPDIAAVTGNAVFFINL